MRASILVPAFLFCSHLSADNQVAERGRGGGERRDFRNNPSERHFDEHQFERRNENWRHDNVNVNPVVFPGQQTQVILPDEEDQIYNQNQGNF